MRHSSPYPTDSANQHKSGLLCRPAGLLALSLALSTACAPAVDMDDELLDACENCDSDALLGPIPFAPVTCEVIPGLFTGARLECNLPPWVTTNSHSDFALSTSAEVKILFEAGPNAEERIVLNLGQRECRPDPEYRNDWICDGDRVTEVQLGNTGWEPGELFRVTMDVTITYDPEARDIQGNPLESKEIHFSRKLEFANEDEAGEFSIDVPMETWEIGIYNNSFQWYYGDTYRYDVEIPYPEGFDETSDYLLVKLAGTLPNDWEDDGVRRFTTHVFQDDPRVLLHYNNRSSTTEVTKPGWLVVEEGENGEQVLRPYGKNGW